nr:Site-specific DNA-methyltransferase (cytosine-N(4)-specific) [Cryobacterium sp.]
MVSLSLTNRTNLLTHGLHRFPAKYIPQVPRWGLDSYAALGSYVLDPFAGSGTTNLEAAAHGYSSVALEINPLSRLIIRAKNTPIPDDELEAAAKRVRAAWRPHEGPLRAPMAGVVNFDHWFSDATWRQLAGLKDAVKSETEPGAIREFFLVVFSSIIRAVSNADDQSQKTYVSGTRIKSPPPVTSTWDNAVRRSLSGMSELNQTAARHTHVTVPDTGNALDIPFEANTFDLAVTSPPYLDSVDYPYNLMLEHFWLADELGLPSRQDFNQLRHGQVGAKNPASAEDPPRFISDLLEVETLPEYRRTAVLSYFAMMDQHFSEMARVLKDGARYVFVVGNSGTKIGPLPIHKALIGLAQTHGLGLEHAFGYRLRRHYMKFPRAGRGGIILVDWVLTLRKGLQSDLEVPDLVDSHVEVDPRAVAY